LKILINLIIFRLIQAPALWQLTTNNFINNFMLKTLYQLAALSVSLIQFTTEIGLSNPQQPINFHHPIVSQADASLPVCYMQTTDGITLDLSNMCKKTTQKPDVYSENGSPPLEPPTRENPPINESPLGLISYPR
jgi:hypothetical protein